LLKLFLSKVAGGSKWKTQEGRKTTTKTITITRMIHDSNKRREDKTKDANHGPIWSNVPDHLRPKNWDVHSGDGVVSDFCHINLPCLTPRHYEEVGQSQKWNHSKMYHL
jgi:hypothetical protein